ncbi:MAG: hypothetical protein DMG02_33005 [Acidobacteria bacterium]|nr:MAG: hypothetical protein DMG02_33005 [Acidobacteriota bacterium]
MPSPSLAPVDLRRRAFAEFVAALKRVAPHVLVLMREDRFPKDETRVTLQQQWHRLKAIRASSIGSHSRNSNGARIPNERRR